MRHIRIFVIFAALVPALLITPACGSELVDNPLVHPDKSDIDKDAFTSELDIAIKVASCDGTEPQRQSALLVYHPGNSILEYYAQYHYDVRWYVDDHILISDEIWLDCIGQGTFTVEITDTQNNAFGRKVIEL